MTTCKISWMAPDHRAFEWLQKVKDAGVKVICIDPIKTETCQFFDGEWIAPKPQTDTALMIGIAHTLLVEGLHDQKFLDRYTVGFKKFQEYLEGKEDGVPKTAQWASEICGIKADKIRELARTFAKNRTMLSLGWSTQRQHHGEQASWTLVTLASMLGQIGLPGGGYGLSYNFHAGVPGHLTPSIPGMTDGRVVGEGELPPGCLKEATSPYCTGKAIESVPVARISDMLLNPGKVIDYNGGKVKYPDIKLCYWVGGNPFAHHQNRNEMLKAWRQLQTSIVHDFQWTASARHADIVLPVTTSYEKNDIDIVGDFGFSHIMPMKQVIKPMYESRSDYDIFADISERLGAGLRDVFTEGLTEMDWIRNSYEKGRLIARAKGIEIPVFNAFWESNDALEFPVTESDNEFVFHADFRNDPLLNPLGTPSGKIEIFSNTVDKMKYDDCPGHATWMEPIERLDGPTTHYPLHITSNHPTNRLHSQLCGTTLRKRYAIAGREPCWISPEDAAKRGLKSGDVARAFNDRGQILVGIRVTDEIRPGVIRIDEGGWYDPAEPGKIGTLCRYGDVNNLTTSVGTSRLGQSTCAQTGVCEVEKFRGEIPEVMVFSEPSMSA